MSPSRSKREAVDPAQPHEFAAVRDPGIAAVASGGGQLGYGSAGPAATTGAYQRSLRCAVPGCGRERSDPIHGVAEG